MQSEPGIQMPRATAHPLFDLAPGGACHDGRSYPASRPALTRPFHPYRNKFRRYTFCCAILPADLLCGIRLKRTPCSAESGLSSGISPGGRRRRFPVINIRPSPGFFQKKDKKRSKKTPVRKGTGVENISHREKITSGSPGEHW